MDTSLAVKIRELDFAALSEPERVALIGDIRARLAHLASMPMPSPEVFHERIELLKQWHGLAQLRVADLIADVPPPPPGTKIDTMFPPEEPEEHVDAEEHVGEEEETAHEAADIVLPEDLHAPGESLIPVRLLETGIVNGMRLPAGIVVDVTPEDAAHLLESGKARYPEEAPPAAEEATE